MTTASSTTQVPPSLTSLGRRALPAWIDVRGRRYDKRRVFKNDFFAITAMYEGDAGRVLLKIHRQSSFLLIPLEWVGRLLAARECRAFERLSDVEGVPRLIERWGKTGLVREFIEGHPLRRGERVDDDFHARLRRLVDTIHQRGMAYVDLEKCENVLVGDDGRPHLFDFQIAWQWPRRWGGELWPARWLRHCLQAGDRYHLIKLQRRSRPDQLTPDDVAASYRRPWYVRLHRHVTWPFTWCRRRILSRVAPQRVPGERGRVGEEKVTGLHYQPMVKGPVDTGAGVTLRAGRTKMTAASATPSRHRAPAEHQPPPVASTTNAKNARPDAAAQPPFGPEASGPFPHPATAEAPGSD